MFVRGQRAIVTGGASGLGEATARALAEASAIVTIFDMNEEQGSVVATDIKGHFAKVDVSDEASLDQGFASAREAHGQERILINCAGIASGDKTASRDKTSGTITPIGCRPLPERCLSTCSAPSVASRNRRLG